jgi:hypothetical protein
MTNLKRPVLACALLVAVGMVRSASASPITYNLNLAIGSGSVTGSIRTDGTVGILATENLLDWTILVNDGSTSSTFIPGNTSAYQVNNYQLLASPTQLTFNFGGQGFLFFQSGLSWLCLDGVTGSCTGHASAAVVNEGGPWQVTAERGVVVVGAAAVPEPSTWLLLGTGVAGLAATRRWIPRRARRNLNAPD